MKSFLSALTIVFVTLKLTGYITWSWWLVFLPLYGGFLISIFFLIIAIAAIDAMPSPNSRYRKRK